MAATSATTTRRSQAARSAATRQALLDATIACLVEDGYAKTTTSRVAERAGVSRGAHLHHFQTRSALVAAAVEHLRVRRAQELMAAADALPSGRERVTQGLDLLWIQIPAVVLDPSLLIKDNRNHGRVSLIKVIEPLHIILNTWRRIPGWNH